MARFRTVNAMLIESGDELITNAVRQAKADGKHVEEIARYYNIFIRDDEIHTNKDWGIIPDKLYEVLYR